MLKSIFKSSLLKFNRNPVLDKGELINKCDELISEGKARDALDIYKDFRNNYPDDADILNNVACISDVLGLKEESAKYFLLAYQLDDRNLPVALNYIKFNFENGNIAVAMEAIKNLLLDGFSAKSYLVLIAGIHFRLGNAAIGREYVLESWLNDFSHGTYANNYLMYSTYSEKDESQITAEHIFWAETLPPVVLKESALKCDDFLVNEKGSRIRLAYWSPDFKNHSIRYFFRAVIESHSREDFETICYHDSFAWDDQTDEISKHADYFFQVNELTDSALLRLMKSHKLDILVELAGHTSLNRLHLFQERIAKVQMTGFGYPPTTGLRNIDYKILDNYVVEPHTANQLYAENILALESSFWCFDPKIKVPISASPPMSENGFVTFGCFGNIAKITDEIISAWRCILDGVPNSLLIIRSISFEDDAAISTMKGRLTNSGITEVHFRLLPPLGVNDLFGSYNSIDIILDTYPFSGGTTTCFATYMGVPVLTLVGLSLASRMGGSVMRSLGMQEWVCNSLEEYIDKGISFSSDSTALKSFRAEARSRFDASPLGNGKLFVCELERSYRQALAGQIPRSNFSSHKIEEQEILRRARRIMASGDYDGAMRVVNYCLKEYPGCGEAIVMLTWQFIEKREFDKGASLIRDRLPTATSGLPDMYVQALRIAVYAGDKTRYHDTLQEFREHCADSSGFKDKFFLKLVDLPLESKRNTVDYAVESKGLNLLFIVLGENNRAWSFQKTSENDDITYLYVNYSERLEFYKQIEDMERFDYVVIIRSDYTINNSGFIDLIKKNLENLDVMGFSGARNWERFDWLNGPISSKAACMWLPVAGHEGMFELNLYTSSFNETESGMVVLDGGFMVMKPELFDRFRFVEWPFEVGGGDFLFEQYSVNRLANAGYHLGVCKVLGLTLDADTSFLIDKTEVHDVKRFVSEKLGFENLFPSSDYSCLAFPFENIGSGIDQLTKVLT